MKSKNITLTISSIFCLCVNLVFPFGQLQAGAHHANAKQAVVLPIANSSFPLLSVHLYAMKEQMADVGIVALMHIPPEPRTMKPIERPTPEPTETPTPTPTPAPTPSPAPDPELERLEREAKLAEARKIIAQAEKDEAQARKEKAEADEAETKARQNLAKAKLGIGVVEPGATPPSGNISAGDAPRYIETQLLAEAGVRMASNELVRQICSITTPSPAPSPVAALVIKPIKTLVINSPGDKAAIGHYRTIVGQLEFLHDHYAKLIKQSFDERDDAKAEAAALPLLIPAATEMVKNAADLINLFRTDTEFKSQEVNINTRMIVSNITNLLLRTNTGQCKVQAIYQPAIYPLSVPKDVKNKPLLKAYRQLLDDVSKGESEVNANKTKVAELSKQKTELAAEIVELRKKLAEQKKKSAQAAERQAAQRNKTKKGIINSPQVPEESLDIQKTESDIREDEEFIGKLDRRISRLNQAAANLENFKATLASLFQLLSAVDDTTKQPVLVQLISAERLSEILATDDTYVLDLSIKASGTNRIRRNMFFNAKLAHTGGVSIDAGLYNSQDQLVFGRLEDFYIEFTGSEDIRKRMGFKKLDGVTR